jgi:hypothetical protein
MIAAAHAAAMDAASPAALPGCLIARDGARRLRAAHEVVMMHEARPQVAAGKNAQIDVRVSKLREDSGSRTNP